MKNLELVMSRGNTYFFDKKKNQAYNCDDDIHKKIDVPNTCKHCGKTMEDDEPDSCLGILPGVKHACCGHGKTADVYVIFEDETEMRGTNATLYFLIMKLRKQFTFQK